MSSEKAPDFAVFEDVSPVFYTLSVLSVLYGPFQPHLERAFLAELKALKEGHPLKPVAVVTPSRRLADRLQRLVAKEARLSLANIRFHTFYSLALEMVREAGGLQGDLVKDPMFLDRIIDDLLDEGHAGPKPRPRGVAASYRSSLKDLVDAGVEPHVLKLMEDGLLEDGDAAVKLKGLLELAARYRKRLKKLGVVSSSELTRQAARAASRSPVLQGYRRLLYYGFYDLTGLQADFFEAVAQAAEVTLFYPYRKGHPAFGFCDRFFDTKLHLGGRSPKPLEDEAAGKFAVGEAFDALFVPGRVASLPAGRLQVFSASGARDEAWRVAKEILRLVEEEGYRFDEIGVAARTLDTYRAPLVEAFKQSQVPFDTTASEPLARRPLARLCWKLLALRQRDFPALAVLDIVESPYFRGEAGPHWRALVRRLRIHRGWLQWEGKLEPATRKDFQLYPQLAAEGRPGLTVARQESKALWDRLADWRSRLCGEEKKKWSEWVEACLSLLEDTFAPGQDADSGWAETVAGLASLRAFDRLGEPVAYDIFLEAFEERLAKSGREITGPQRFGVRLLDAMEARGDSFRALFVVGMQEGVFPRAIREDPLLRDSARVVLREVGGYWLGAKQEGYDEEKLLFALLVGAARERLTVSYPRSDEDGRARIPSMYLLDLCRATGHSLGGLTEHVPRQPGPRLTDARLGAYLSPKEATVASALTGADAAPILKELGADPGEWKEELRRVSALTRYGQAGALDGVIGSPKEYLEQLRANGLSPTALETVARCPFQFFASRVLALEEPQEPSEAGEVAASVKGEIYHAVLSSFYAGLKEGGYFKSKPKAFPEVEFAAAEAGVFKEFGWREMGVYPLLWEVTRDRMRASLRRFIQADLEELRSSGWRPDRFEYPLSARLSVRLPKELKGMPFQGRADRIDVAEGRFRVIDYKTRWNRGPLVRLVASGGAMQPPVYLELARAQEEFAGAQAEGVRFSAIENEEDGVQDYSAGAHDASKGAVLELLAGFIDRIAKGAFVIRPDDGEFGHCRWCSFGALCRKSHPLTRLRSEAESGLPKRRGSA